MATEILNSVMPAGRGHTRTTIVPVGDGSSQIVYADEQQSDAANLHEMLEDLLAQQIAADRRISDFVNASTD